MPFLRYIVSIGFPQTVSTYSENVAHADAPQAPARLLRKCCAYLSRRKLYSASGARPNARRKPAIPRGRSQNSHIDREPSTIAGAIHLRSSSNSGRIEWHRLVGAEDVQEISADVGSRCESEPLVDRHRTLVARSVRE